MKSGRPPRSAHSDFGARLRQLRERAGLSQAEVARRLGIRQPSYALWESYNVALKPEQVVALAGIFAVPVAELFPAALGPSSQRRPPGRAGDLFAAVSRLPRRQQQKVCDILEPFIRQFAASK